MASSHDRLSAMSTPQAGSRAVWRGATRFGGSLLRGDHKRVVCGRKGVKAGSIRSETPARGHDEPKDFLQPYSTIRTFQNYFSRAVDYTSSQLIASSIPAKAEHLEVESESTYSDDLVCRSRIRHPSRRSITSQALHLASGICEGVETEKSKKPHRLSSASRDLFD